MSFNQVAIWNVIHGKHFFDDRYDIYVNGCPDVVLHPVCYDEVVLAHDKKNVLTNNGRDWMHAQVYTNTAAGTRGAGFIAVSVNAGGADAAHTAVAGEIVTGGLERADATTKTHSAGTNSTTIAHTFTAGAQHTAVQLGGLFNAASGVTLVHENTFTPASLESADTLTVTATLNLG